MRADRKESERQSEYSDGSLGCWASVNWNLWPHRPSRSRSRDNLGIRSPCIKNACSDGHETTSALKAELMSAEGRLSKLEADTSAKNCMFLTDQLAKWQGRCELESEFVVCLANQFGFEHNRVKQLMEELEQTQGELRTSVQAGQTLENRVMAQYRDKCMENRDLKSEVEALELTVASDRIRHENAMAESKASLAAYRKHKHSCLRETETTHCIIQSEMEGLHGQLSRMVDQREMCQSRSLDCEDSICESRDGIRNEEHVSNVRIRNRFPNVKKAPEVWSMVCRSDGKVVKEGYKCMHCTAVNSLAEIEGFAETQPNNLCRPCNGINNLREALDAEIKRNGVRL